MALTNKFFKQFYGTREEFEAALVNYTAAERVALSEAIVFIHQRPKYYDDASAGSIAESDHKYTGWIYANGFFYTAADTVGLTAETVAALVDNNGGCKVEVVDGKLVFTPQLTQALKVTGVTVGNLSDSTAEFAAGTSIESILRQMLMKRIGLAAPTKPSVTITGVTPTTVEVGTSTDYTLGYKDYKDGKFNGASGYSYTLAAGCEIDDTKDAVYKAGTSTLASNTYTYAPTAEGSVSLSVSVPYKASTATPVDNMGDAATTNNTIAAGNATSNGTVKAYYKYYFVVNSEAVLTENSTFFDCSMNITENVGWLDSDKTVLGANEVAIGDATTRKYLYILIPSSKNAPKFQNAFGIEGEMPVIATGLNNGLGTEYTLYGFSGAGDAYKNCKIVK